MAAIITSTSLTILEKHALKHSSSTAEPTCPLPPLPTCLTWSAENNTVYLSSATSGILQYDVASGSLQDVSVHDQSSDPVVALLSKDRGSTLIYAKGQHITVLSAHSGKISHTFDTHKATISSLSLSNDGTLLASTSAHAIHIHNLTLASHTVLRGIPVGGGEITTCAFHPHSRTRLLVGLGTQLLVYDTTRPSGPAKVIPLDKEQKQPGPIVSISCSPFSKTLVAVACSAGMITLIDLEKEKGLFRTVNMPAPVTCLSFSAEGAAVYAGTENGKLMILDLRALDKPPKTVSMSQTGDQVIALSVQKKLKPDEAQVAKPAAAPAAKPLVQRDTNKAAPNERRTGSSSGPEVKKAVEDKAASKKLSTTPVRRVTSRVASNPNNGSPVARAAVGARRLNAGQATSPAARRAAAPKNAFSPPRSPVNMPDKRGSDEQDSDLFVRAENLLALPRAKEPAPVAVVDDDEEAPFKAVPLPSVLSRVASRGQISHGQPPRSHTRTEIASRPTSELAAPESQAESASKTQPRVRSASSGSIASRASKASSTATRRIVSSSSASSNMGVGVHRKRVSGSSLASRISRSPSPELAGKESEVAGPVTPIPAYKRKGKEKAAARALGSTEIDGWVRAGDNKAAGKEGRRVGFSGDSDSEGEAAEIARAAPDDMDEEDARVPPAAFAMQVSPRRSYGAPSSNSRRTAWAPVPSPLRNPAAPPSPQARAAQDMLQALMRDALHDFRQETKAEIVGLHLDLIRMGTGWRTEMREAMGEVAEEIRALREENRKLREENERLRRGY